MSDVIPFVKNIQEKTEEVVTETTLSEIERVSEERKQKMARDRRRENRSVLQSFKIKTRSP